LVLARKYYRSYWKIPRWHDNSNYYISLTIYFLSEGKQSWKEIEDVGKDCLPFLLPLFKHVFKRKSGLTGPPKTNCYVRIVR
jgi:hypothetical protein